jgi:hypothetical protein
MDFKYVPYALEGKQYYQLSCVDHHSSWRLIRIYPHKDLIAVTSFLKELEALCPFTIKQLQTDNDLAFTDKYRQNTDGEPTGSHPVDLWCEKWEMPMAPKFKASSSLRRRHRPFRSFSKQA